MTKEAASSPTSTIAKIGGTAADYASTWKVTVTETSFRDNAFDIFPE